MLRSAAWVWWENILGTFTKLKTFSARINDFKQTTEPSWLCQLSCRSDIRNTGRNHHHLISSVGFYNYSNRACSQRRGLRWLSKVSTVCTPEEGWTTKNDTFVFQLWVKIRNTPGISCILLTVATATNNRKDNLFFAVFHLFASFSRVSLGKISWNSAVLWKRFRTIL